ncbi:sugar ABC transporter permease [Aquiluna sp.]|jgi:alpha-glucoside transport system permease protein|nr:sugar ABC transporter permease [Aquiluna sp.]MDA8901790.1 sugar ABC transporter permease [Aquiluna sp.]
MGDIIFGLIAVTVGIGASYGLYWLLNALLSFLPEKILKRVQWIAFLTPALVLVTLVLLVPIVQTFIWSFMDKRVENYVGFDNYVALFTDPNFLSVLVNNFLWVLVVPAITVAIGTAVATLTNQVGPTREKIFKTLIFMPMSISFVAAATIWSLTYAYVPPGRPEVGVLNSIMIGLGLEAQPWLTISDGRLNTFLLMAVLVWLQVGYSMVIISAAIKAVPEETLEAARLDAANAWQVFRHVILPQVWGSIMAVFVTVLILVMKIFDVVLAMTGGNFDTSVLALEWFRVFFESREIGPASAIVVVLFVLIVPLMYVQIRTVKQQEELR